ncbi:MAG: LLM class flavin-dependent oxidoreductase, partial [Chloroflexi bacterium]
FTPRLVRRVATLGDGWMPYVAYGMTLPEKAEAIRVLRDRYAAEGRDPATLEVADTLVPVDGSVARTLEQVPAAAAAGIDVMRVPLRRFVTHPAQVQGVMEDLVRRFEEYRR